MVALGEQAILAFLLLTGYAAMGGWLDRNSANERQGLRAGWDGKVRLDWAWPSAGHLRACIIPMTLVGGIAIFLD